MKTLLISLILTAAAFAQATTLTVAYDGTVPNTTITVASSTGITLNDSLLLCNSQVLKVSAKAGTVLSVAQSLGGGNATSGAVCAIGTSVIDITQTPPLTFNAESWGGLNTFLAGQLSGTQTTLTTALASGDTVINVASTAGFSNVDSFVICGEAISTTAKTSTTLTIGSRAQWNTTTPATCTNGTVVAEAKYKGTQQALKQMVQGVVAGIMQNVQTASVAAQQAALASAQTQPAPVAQAVQ